MKKIEKNLREIIGKIDLEKVKGVTVTTNYNFNYIPLHDKNRDEFEILVQVGDYGDDPYLRITHNSINLLLLPLTEIKEVTSKDNSDSLEIKLQCSGKGNVITIEIDSL